jgi:isocitrate dehydrogenase kinase/phosphatase
MPRKRLAELYNALGHHKHGKTELYRELRDWLAANEEQFEFAPGRRGMVMIVFTLPSFDMVFKVIKDEFDPPKRGSRDTVKQAYRLVTHHDRVGRLVDAQEFEHLELDRARFKPELLETLLTRAGEVVELRGDQVVLKHVYAERRVTPLDLLLEQGPPEAALAALLDWGAAVKNLAAADIFPGDLFLKNFGVTRHGRVVFYDYDEITLVTRCRFRRLPEPRHDEDETAAEPWFQVGDDDIFPEEIIRFLGIPEELRAPFLAVHGDLFDAPFWQAVQDCHAQGVVIDVFPYSAAARLRPGAAGDTALAA